MANTWKNDVKFASGSTGTGSFSIGAAVDGFRTPAQAGYTNGQTVSYTARAGTAFESGLGTYNTSGPVLERTTVRQSSNSNNAVDFATAPVVMLAPLAEDFDDINAALAKNILTTRGDLLRRGASAPERVALGAADKLLVSDGTDPVWLEALGHALGMVNGTLVPTVGSSALTIALKTLAGADPSASDPVWVFFRSATAANGDYAKIKVTAATSLVITSGSTLGAPTGSVPFKVWIVGFNDGGTFRLGAMVATTLAAGVLTQYPLAAWGIASSTAEGAAGAADSAQTFYTGTAVTSKAYTTLGYLSFETGLTTAGTWAAAPTRTQLFGPGVALPGTRWLLGRNDTGAVATGSTAQQQDDTIPQNTEGDQYISQAGVPSSAANVLMARAQLMLSSTDIRIITSMFRDSTANALVATETELGGAYYIVVSPLSAVVLANSTSSTTFKVRAGAAAGTTTFNGSNSARRFGGVVNSWMELWEIAA